MFKCVPTVFNTILILKTYDKNKLLKYNKNDCIDMKNAGLKMNFKIRFYNLIKIIYFGFLIHILIVNIKIVEISN